MIEDVGFNTTAFLHSALYTDFALPEKSQPEVGDINVLDLVF